MTRRSFMALLSAAIVPHPAVATRPLGTPRSFSALERRFRQLTVSDLLKRDTPARPSHRTYTTADRLLPS